nr:immunoglobulin light chain junction region [Macaca mulatta]MOV66410.1 immunoglobulin light chain junction region [Macaca mulatta]MOV66876.1 immunoglobulin light chain junction region [Macaca mulatta]MOV67042.1 immunoglobulin light chain junction region [Macaca mulatta]MOV67210.1 immunoglobulin light chain junction region [Macaca mulatta]
DYSCCSYRSGNTWLF